MNRHSFRKIFCARGAVWFLLLLVLILNFAIRWRLREMPLERDEGEYAYAGQLLLQGIPPYQLAWNMKFPGVYFGYAGLMAAFGQTPTGIHAGVILVTSLSIVLVFLIGRKWMGDAGGLMAAAFFTLLSSLPAAYGMAGHATHFVVLFACAGAWCLLVADETQSRKWTFLSGTAFGVAILMKQPAVTFFASGGLWLLWQNLSAKRDLPRMGIFVAGTALPLALMAVALAGSGVWQRFDFWTIEYARQYVSILPARAVPIQFVKGFSPLIESGVWVWLMGATALALIFFRSPQRGAAIGGAALFLAGLAAVFPGYYFRGHYFLMAMPGLALLNAALLLALAEKLKHFPQVRILTVLPTFLFVAVMGDMVVRNAAIWFHLAPNDASRKLYGYNPFPESAEIARYLAGHTTPAETIAVLGSEPQIFFLAHRRSASGYIYVYPLTEPQPLARTMADEFTQEIENARPKYVVYVNELSSWRSTVIPGETSQILDHLNQWWNGYSENYQLAGSVDIHEDRPSEFFWDDQLSSRTNTQPADISIFCRK
jgi:hypothetical protein